MMAAAGPKTLSLVTILLEKKRDEQKKAFKAHSLAPDHTAPKASAPSRSAPLYQGHGVLVLVSVAAI